MESGKERARRPARVWGRARWVSIVPALILIFFVASAAISPRTTQAVDEASDPITPATSVPTDEAPPPTPTVVATSTVQPTSAPAGFAGGLNTSVEVVQPTAISTPAPTAIATPSVTAMPPTAMPPTAVPLTATPSGPTATPNQGAAGNAQAIDGVIRVPVLMYHYIRVNPVASDRLGFNLSVTPADFAAQMAWLVSNGYHTIFPSELNAALTQGTPMPTKPIVLTFDDGYRDFYDQAWPVLKQYGLKSSSAVITTAIDKGDRGDTQYMNWNMVKELDKTGMVEIASHTLSHPDLSRTAPAQRWLELSKSKEIIEQQIGHTCTTFVYPSGKYDGATVSDASRAGYQIAFTTNDGKVRVPQDSGPILVLPRVRVAGGTTIPVFAKSIG